MTSNRYAAAGWAAILSAAGSLVMLGLSFGFELWNRTSGAGLAASASWSSAQWALVAGVDAIAWALGIFALLRFRTLLNERYDFHALDHLIWVVIGAGLVMAIASHAYRLLAEPGMKGTLAGLATTGSLGVVNGIIGIVFATRLLRLNGNLNGYKKPLAYTYLVGSVCFLLVIPAVLGIVLLAVSSILLGLALFRGEELEELEVV